MESLYAEISNYLIDKKTFKLNDVMETVLNLSDRKENAIQILNEILESNLFIKRKDYYIYRGV